MRSSQHDNGRLPDQVDRLVAIHAQLTAAVEDLTRSEAWRRMLTVAARMPTYSPSNVLLIATQRPEATRVAGFAAWKSVGRHVRKGERGIAILAPCLHRRQEETATQPGEEPAAESDPTARRQLSGFRVVHVFDVTQTDGEPLPDIDPTELEGRAPERLWEQLAELAKSDGFTLERGACSGAYGHTRFDDRTIRIRADVDPAQAVKTLAHEIGHIRADHEARFLGDYHRSPACRGRAEVEAESIAYLIAAEAGLDTSNYSVAYVANWSGGDTRILRETASHVLATGRAILRTLQPIPVVGSASADLSMPFARSSRTIGRPTVRDSPCA
jgi:antirestriction protein ArdC